MTGREIGTPMRHFGGGGPLRVINAQTVPGTKSTFVCFGSIADKRECRRIVR
jgi:hypothetical protein